VVIGGGAVIGVEGAALHGGGAQAAIIVSVVVAGLGNRIARGGFLLRATLAS
jgi:hypothetical protein